MLLDNDNTSIELIDKTGEAFLLISTHIPFEQNDTEGNETLSMLDTHMQLCHTK